MTVTGCPMAAASLTGTASRPSASTGSAAADRRRSSATGATDRPMEISPRVTCTALKATGWWCTRMIVPNTSQTAVVQAANACSTPGLERRGHADRDGRGPG